MSGPTTDMLVVVDMQTGFPASSHQPTLANVRREILHAKAAGWRIVFLVVNPHLFGHTRPELLSLCRGNANATVVDKDLDDGSCWVWRLCSDNGWCPLRFHLVGVNKQACVSRTALGLAEWFPESAVIVVDDACYGLEGDEPFEYWLWEVPEFEQEDGQIPENLLVRAGNTVAKAAARAIHTA